jgi:hypothetical protein
VEVFSHVQPLKKEAIQYLSTEKFSLYN